ncbi:cytidylyltransferase domain-containing protein [Rhodococcus pyridinivorans]|uniref:cytidylyltransferase domain-containing protein n=1 Tax=Rhodococcus pyridinivorans TaxID=103816 RepID=UPI003AAF497B
MSSPDVIAIIPARGGSKGIPKKNLQKVGGRELIVRAIEACRSAQRITTVIVSTDDDTIARVARSAGAEVHMRPDDLATDTASSESALLHVLDAVQRQARTPDVVAFVQCTSPFIRAIDLDGAIAQLWESAADTVISVTPSHRFIWEFDAGQLRGVNHDGITRKRRQDLKQQYLETGAFYILRTSGFIEKKTRFFGKTEAFVVPEWTAHEIDTPDDLEIARATAAFLTPVEKIPARALITDFDGVHTDDTAYLTDDGREAVRVNRSDGMGVGLLRDAGVPILIISKEKNSVVARRAEKLKVDVRQGIDEKLSVLIEWLQDIGVSPADTAYVGNDINDLECMRFVGWPVAVSNAHPELLRVARVVLTSEGGLGAVREVADRILTI